jgi:hypothetical protein
VHQYVWVLIVLVFNDGEWRDWRSYNRLEECLEVAHTIAYRREDILDVKCERRIRE